MLVVKNNKGFTLVELLVTVVIIGLLSGVAIVSVSKTQQKSHIEYDEKQNQLFTTAAQAYYQDNRKTLTSLKLLSVDSVSLQTLIDQNYIDKVVDYKKKEYDYQKSKAYVKKTGAGKYIYYSELYGEDGLRATNKPGGKETGKGSTITIGNPKKEDNTAYEKFKEPDGSGRPNFKCDVYYVKDKAKIDITINNPNGISSYQYRINKASDFYDGSVMGGKEYKKSGEIGIDNTTYSDTIEIDAKDFANGIYRLHIDAYSYSSAVSTDSANYLIVIDKIKPKCKIEFGKGITESNLEKSNAEQTVDNITANGNTVEGNETKKWFHQISFHEHEPLPVKMTITEKNKYKYYLDTSSYKENKSSEGSYEYVLKYKNYGDDTGPSGQKWYGAVEDKAGNIGYCDNTVYVDRTPPKCNVTKKASDGSTIGNDVWTNQNYSATKTCNDNQSGCIADSKSETVSVEAADGTVNNNIIFTDKVFDKAGNSDKCEVNANLDKEKPTCSVTSKKVKSGASYDYDYIKYNNETAALNACPWTNEDVKIEATCNDNKGSGCTNTTFSTIYQDTVQSSRAGAAGNGNGGSFTDKVGNTIDCKASKSIKIDKEGPDIKSMWRDNCTADFYGYVKDTLSGLKEYAFSQASDEINVKTGHLNKLGSSDDDGYSKVSRRGVTNPNNLGKPYFLHAWDNLGNHSVLGSYDNYREFDCLNSNSDVHIYKWGQLSKNGDGCKNDDNTVFGGNPYKKYDFSIYHCNCSYDALTGKYNKFNYIIDAVNTSGYNHTNLPYSYIVYEDKNACKNDQNNRIQQICDEDEGKIKGSNLFYHGWWFYKKGGNSQNLPPHGIGQQWLHNVKPNDSNIQRSYDGNYGGEYMCSIACSLKGS